MSDRIYLEHVPAFAAVGGAAKASILIAVRQIRPWYGLAGYPVNACDILYNMPIGLNYYSCVDTLAVITIIYH